jgi:signal transduction histidine kinase
MELSGAIRQVRDAAGKLMRRTIADAESEPVMDQAAGGGGGLLQPAASLRSAAYAPISIKGEPIGLLGMFSGKEEAFTAEDRDALGIVAEQLGAALRNAFLVEALRKADESKNELLSIVSHELATPLTAIKEGIDLMLDGSLGVVTDEQREFLATVHENAGRLEQLIDKVKSATEIISGQLRFTFESFDLRQVLTDVEKAYGPMAKGRGVSFRRTEPPKALFWQVDLKHLTQAINQVVENALQATPRDGNVVMDLSSSQSEAVFRITDTGKGIPKELLPSSLAAIEALPSLFDRFQSLGGIHDRKMGGLGLGLFITKSLVEGHGGSIQVESEVDAGTRFTIRLPKQSPSSS